MSSFTPRRWTREEYDRMVDAGILHEDERVQLIEGEILEMTPQKRLHAAAVLLATDVLGKTFGDGYTIQCQLPLAISDDSEPEPDVAVVTGVIRDYRDAHPATAVLIVEVADSSLVFDRRRKARVYGRHGIPEYWIVNLVDRCLEVHRDPRPEGTGSPVDPHYDTVTTVDAAGSIAPLARPAAIIPIADLLP